MNTIRKAGRISLVNINEKWITTDMSGGVEMARATFNRHKDAIQDIFGIYIDCDRKNGYKYFPLSDSRMRIRGWKENCLDSDSKKMRKYANISENILGNQRFSLSLHPKRMRKYAKYSEI